MRLAGVELDGCDCGIVDWLSAGTAGPSEANATCSGGSENCSATEGGAGTPVATLAWLGGWLCAADSPAWPLALRCAFRFMWIHKRTNITSTKKETKRRMYSHLQSAHQGASVRELSNTSTTHRVQAHACFLGTEKPEKAIRVKFPLFRADATSYKCTAVVATRHRQSGELLL